MTARAHIHFYVRADVRCPGDVARLDAFVVHAQVVVRDVQQAGARRERRWLEVFRARGRWADVAGDDTDVRRLRRVGDVSAGFQIDSARRVHKPERSCRIHLPARAIHHIEKAVALGAEKNLALDSIDRHVDEHVLVDRVVVEQIVRAHLVKPFRSSGIGITSEHAGGPLVIAGPLVRIPWTGIACAVIDEIQIRIV